MARSRAALFAAVLSVLAACRVYDPNLLTRDGGAGSSLRRPPARPAIADSPDNNEAMYFALRDVLLNQRNGAWSEIGYDLDNTFTRIPERVPSCEPRANRDQPVLDGVEGIDNAFGSTLYPVIALILANLEDNAQNAQLRGYGNLVVRIRGWNGLPNDPRIELAIVQSAFATPPAADGSIPRVTVGEDGVPRIGGTPAPPPAWDGRDFWFIRSDSYLDGRDPVVLDDNAFVRDSMLVMSIRDGAGLLFLTDQQSVLVRIHGGVSVGRLSADGSRIMRIVVAGRWPLTDLRDTAERVGICRGTTQYDLLNEVLDRAADVRVDGRADPTLPCDGVSLGTVFEGYRVNFAGAVNPTPVPNPCATAR